MQTQYLFITYLINFFYYFDELSSHSTVALSQPQSQIVYSLSKHKSCKIDSIISSTSITCISQLISSIAQLIFSRSFSAQFSKLTPDTKQRPTWLIKSRNHSTSVYSIQYLNAHTVGPTFMANLQPPVILKM